MWGEQVPILGYHRVGLGTRDHVPTVSPEVFQRQLQWLSRWGYRVVTLDEVIAVLDGGPALPRRSVAITFDDGYDEVYRYAWPLLKQHRFSATMFITPAEVGLPGFVNWEQANEMARDGCAIGSHTMHHTYLPLASESQVVEEIAGSKHAIESRLGRSIRYLSYPVGGFTPAAIEVARQAGYHGACTTNRAISRWAIDRYALRRVKVTDRDNHPLLFWAKVSGYYDLFRQVKQPS